MRRIRRLDICDYLVQVGQKTAQLITSSNCSNSLLERTWHMQSREQIQLIAHAKFNSDTMDGAHISARLMKGSTIKSSVVSQFKIFKVSEVDWSETLVTTLAPTEISFGVFGSTLSQASLGSNELSGREVYAIEVRAHRRRQNFFTKIWVNHLGCFDSLIMLRQQVEFLNISKVDE